MSNSVITWIEHYEYAGIFLALALGLIGLPVPDEVLLTFSGYLVFKGDIHFTLALLSAFFGAMSGISLSYLFGYKLGLPFLEKFGPKIGIPEEKISKTQTYFQRYGSVMILFGYFIPGIRHVSAYLAGFSAMRFKKFAVYAYSGGIIWSFTFIMVGKMLGPDWRIVERYFHHLGKNVLLAVLAAGLLAWIVYKAVFKRT